MFMSLYQYLIMFSFALNNGIIFWSQLLRLGLRYVGVDSQFSYCQQKHFQLCCERVLPYAK